MRRQTLQIAVSLLLVVFLSGCTENDIIGSSFGSEYCSAVGNCKVEEAPPRITDVLQIQTIEARPMAENRVKPDSEITLFVTVQNMHDQKPLHINWIGISNKQSFICSGTCEETNMELNPGAMRKFSFDLTSPSNSGTLAIPQTIEIAAEYSYDSSTLTTFSYMNEDTFKDYLESGARAATTLTNIASEAPVELKVIYGFQQPAIYDEDKDYQIFLEVHNLGGGEIKRIEADDLSLTFEDNAGSFTECSEEFGSTCSGDTVTNSEEIRIMGKKPYRYYFNFNPSGSPDFSHTPVVTTILRTNANYEYRISRLYDILVSPRAQI
ncbi:MAG: hypothetical protein ACP5E4_04525 [Candidatus Aenigmatarchaeota archaeon]